MGLHGISLILKKIRIPNFLFLSPVRVVQESPQVLLKYHFDKFSCNFRQFWTFFIFMIFPKSEFILNYIKTLFFLIWEFWEFADCRFWNLYVDVDFAHNFVVDCRKKFKSSRIYGKLKWSWVQPPSVILRTKHQPYPLPTKRMKNCSDLIIMT